MIPEYSVITLPGRGNYAITLPGQITFIQDASEEELKTAISETVAEYIPEEFLQGEERASLSIIPTFDCNLRCIYCYARGGESKEMVRLEFVRKALKDRKTLRPNAKWLDLYLVGGGEPLLHVDLAKKIYNLALQYFENVQIHLVTNGTFSEEVAHWLVEIKADIRVSYDGLAQSSQRPFAEGGDSKEVVESNIRFLTNAGLDPIIQMIITSNSIGMMIGNAIRAVELGVKVIKVEPALSSEISRGKLSIEPEPIQYAKQLLSLITYIEEERVPLQIDTGFFAKPAVGSYCGMADGNFTLTPSGLITPCVEVARVTDPYMERFNVGKVTKKGLSFSSSNVNFLGTLHYTKQEGGCKDCSLRMICLGGCPMANIWRNGLPLKKSSYTCAIEHAFLPELLLMMAENPIIMDVVMENIILD